MVLQVAKGRGKTLFSVQRVLVDAEDVWAIQTQPLLRFPPGKLCIDPPHGRLADVGAAGQSRRTDAVVVALIDALTQRFAQVPPRHNSGQRLHE